MYLTADELPTYYAKATNMEASDVTTYLMRANAFANGKIGGQLPAEYVDVNLKAVVALAFEVFAKGETAQVDNVTGFITEVAPAGNFVRPPSRQYEPLKAAADMLIPYAKVYEGLQAPSKNDTGIMFL